MDGTGSRRVGWIARSAVLALTLGLALGPPDRAASEPVVTPPAPSPRRDVPSAPSATPLEIERTLAAWMDDAASVVARVSSGETHGSGALVSTHHVLTALHVVGDAAHADVVLPDGRAMQARVVRRDAPRDLVLLALPGDAARCLPMSRSAPEAGAWVVGAGILGGIEHELPPTASVGVVLDASGDLTLALGIAHGMSGGPVLGTSGELVGVVVRLDAAARPDATLLEGVRCESAPIARTIPAHPFDAHEWNLARARALGALDPREPSPRAAWEVELANGWVTTRGVALSPELVLTSVDPDVAALGCAGMRLVGCDATCTEAVVRGELMTLRFPGARLTPLDGKPADGLARGALLSDGAGSAWGVVDTTTAWPGELVPYVPVHAHGCGTMAHRRREQSPRVTLGTVIAHDVPVVRGQLLLDAHGRPAAIDVGHHVQGRGYAVPLAEALARF